MRVDILFCFVFIVGAADQQLPRQYKNNGPKQLEQYCPDVQCPNKSKELEKKKCLWDPNKLEQFCPVSKKKRRKEKLSDLSTELPHRLSKL